MAITDVFFRRYRDVPLVNSISDGDRRFFFQATKLMGDRLWLGASDMEEKCSETTLRQMQVVHDKLAMETGVEFLSPKWWFHNGNSYKHPIDVMVGNFMNQPLSVDKSADEVYKERLSYIELAFRIRGGQINLANLAYAGKLAEAERKDRELGDRPGLRVPGFAVSGFKAQHHKITTGFASVVAELNERMRLEGIRFVYSNGLLHRSDDDLVEQVVAEPFWSLVADSKWVNVDIHMKEAMDKRDRGERDAAFAALQALESTIKIICHEKGWFTGKEKGAHNYIDNLGARANGNWIADWEREALKAVFTEVRNPFGHGPGNQPMPSLSSQQTDWAIDTAMTWIKSLVRRA